MEIGHGGDEPLSLPWLETILSVSCAAAIV
jgi:hypothetical protein